MQDVGADDEVVFAGFETLFHRRLFQIEEFVFDVVEGRQLLLGRPKKRTGNTGKRLTREAGPDKRRNLTGKPPGPSPPFENAQTAAFGQMASGFLDSSRDRGQPMTRVQTFTIEMIQQIG